MNIYSLYRSRHVAAKLAAIAGACVFIAACGTTPEPIIRVEQVLVPVLVSCVPDDFPPAPEYPDESEAQDRAEWLALVLSGDALRRDRLADAEAVIEGCR